MNAPLTAEQMKRDPQMVPRKPGREMAMALFSLSQTQRRLSHRYRRWALEAERDGNRPHFLHYTAEQRRLWRSALFHLDHARFELKGV